jgi:ATP-dependent DNA helicase RecG
MWTPARMFSLARIQFCCHTYPVSKSTTPLGDLQNRISEGIGPKSHWFSEDVPIIELAATLTGMANAEGGLVLFGISPRSSRIVGVRDVDSAIDRIFQAALLAEPPLVLPMPQVERVSGTPIVRVTVPPGLPHIYSLEGRYYRWQGSKTQPIAPRDLRALMMARGVVQFESRVPESVHLVDLESSLVDSYIEILKPAPGESPEDVLLRRGCLMGVEGELCPTYASILLFGRHPQQWLPSATIMAARFPGIAFSDEFIKQEIRGSLPDQLRQAENFVRDHLRSVARLVGLTRLDTPEYPLEAVRELLVNAVAHRDYNQQGDCIHLHIFADRLEVHSPGGLPGPVNLENLLEARFSRNPVIAQVLSDMGFVERLGYGLNRVVTSMRQNNLPDPVFEEVGGTFRVTLKNGQLFDGVDQKVLPDLSGYTKFDLNSRQEFVISHLAARGRITNRAYQEICPDVSPETLRRDLADMVRKSILIRIGDKKSTYYILKK